MQSDPFPNPHDAVLGGQVSAPPSLVLGGLIGIQQQLGYLSNGIQYPLPAQIAALSSALRYGQAGLDLVIQTLQHSEQRLQDAAFALLRDRSEPVVIAALRKNLPYLFYQVQHQPSGHLAPVSALAISPNGRILASCGRSHGHIQLWSLRTGKSKGSLDSKDAQVLIFSRAELGLVSSSGRTRSKLISGSPSTGISVWDWRQRQCLGSLGGKFSRHHGGVGAIATSAYHRILATGGEKWDCTIKLWHMKTGVLLRSLWGHQSAIRCLAISHCSPFLASGSDDGQIKLWDLQQRRILHTLTEHQGPVLTLAISPDGQQLVSGGHDRRLQVWHLPTGELQQTLVGHIGAITSLVITPDGRALISGSDDRTLQIWHLRTGEWLHTLTGHLDGITALAMHPQTQVLASGSRDGMILIWG